jgi:hypothetical protein
MRCAEERAEPGRGPTCSGNDVSGVVGIFSDTRCRLLIDKVTPRGKHLVVEGSMRIRNTSDTKVQVLASTLDVRATRYAPDPVSSNTFADYVHDADLEKFAAERVCHHIETNAVAAACSARPAGFEPATSRSGGERSIH